MQNFQINIPKPCHQNWDKMTLFQQGRFCKVCTKTVVDFSNMCDKDIFNYFKNIKNETVCGRLYSDQLNRIIIPENLYPNKKHLLWKYLAFFIFLFSKTSNSKAQIKNNITINCNKNLKDSTTALVSKPIILENKTSLNYEKIIVGSIIDKENQPIPFASVIIKGKKYGVSANELGRFSIKITDSNAIIQIVALGFLQKEIETNILIADKPIILEKDLNAFLGEIVISTPIKKVSNNKNTKHQINKLK